MEAKVKTIHLNRRVGRGGRTVMCLMQSCYAFVLVSMVCRCETA